MPGTLEEQRIIELEKEVITLRINEAHLIASVANQAKAQEKLSDSVDHLASAVGELQAALNRGRGALWGIGLSASMIGALASYAGSRLFGG